MREAAQRRVKGFRPHAAVVFGSGLAGLPHASVVEAELGYDELGWPCTAVPGHANLLRLARVPAPDGAADLRLALACGRPHFYEGWSEAELRRPVADLAACGAQRVVLTNSCGALRPPAVPGSLMVCAEVVDLQRAPADGVPSPERLPVCTAGEADAVASAVTAAIGTGSGTVPGVVSGAGPGSGGLTVGGIRRVPVGIGAYVAVAGPQFETPAEVAWLGSLGDVVGMSGAPELRAARAAGAACLLLGLVANRAAAIGSHEDVLAVGAALSGSLAAALPAAVLARWPGILTTPGA